MIDRSQTTKKFTITNIKEITSTKQVEKSKALMTPQKLFHGGDELNKTERPSRSDPGGVQHGPIKDTRTRVLTPQGKQVLTSDTRLHQEKIKHENKAPDKQATVNNDVNVADELRRLDSERRMLIEKVKQKKEIARLQKELAEVSGEFTHSEY